MISEASFELQTETGFFDSIWAYFLDDNDIVDDEKSSVDSHGGTHAANDNVSLRRVVYDPKTVENTKEHPMNDEVSKKLILESSLKRSEKLIAYSKKLGSRQKKAFHDRSRIAKRGVVNNKVVNNRKYVGLSRDERDSYLQDSYRRTEELLAYSRRYGSGRKSSVREKAMVIKRGAETDRKYVDVGRDWQEFDNPDNFDADMLRDGPPQIIFVDNEHPDMRKIAHADDQILGKIRVSTSGSAVRNIINGESLPSVRKEEYVEFEESEQERRAIFSRMTRLRMEVAKANMAKASL